MDFPYSKKVSFGKIFQYDENIVTTSKSKNPIIKKQEPNIKKEEPLLKKEINLPMSELDKEINDNPFFFF